MAARLNRETPERGWVDRLRAAALLAVFVGAGGSVWFLLHASEHPPRFLLALFLIWVLSPFAVLLVADAAAKHWSLPARAALYVAMLAVTLGSLITYADDARGHRRAQAAFVYVAVPPASGLLIVIVVATAALASGRRMRRRDGA